MTQKWASAETPKLVQASEPKNHGLDKKQCKTDSDGGSPEIFLNSNLPVRQLGTSNMVVQPNGCPDRVEISPIKKRKIGESNILNISAADEKVINTPCSDTSTTNGSIIVVDNEVSFRLNRQQNDNNEELVPGPVTSNSSHSKRVKKAVLKNSEHKEPVDRDGFEWMDKNDFYSFLAKSIQTIVTNLLKDDLLGGKQEVLGNGDCMFNAILGQRQSNDLTAQLRWQVSENIMAVYKKALKDNDKATIATIHTEVNNWYTKYRDDIERVEGRGVCLKNNQMLRVSAYCKIMQVNQGRFSWGDYDFINYCRALEHINKVLICVYPNVRRSDDRMGVYVYVPKTKLGESLSKQFVQNRNNYCIIVHEGDHFQYYSCRDNEHFRKKVTNLYHDYKVLYKGFGSDGSSPSCRTSQNTGVMQNENNSLGNSYCEKASTSYHGNKDVELKLSEDDRAVAFSDVVKEINAETKICKCNNTFCFGGIKWKTVRGRVQHEILSIRNDNRKNSNSPAKVKPKVTKSKSKTKPSVEKSAPTSVNEDDFGRIIQQFVDNEIEDTGKNSTSSNDSNNRHSAEYTDILEIIPDLQNVFEGSYKLKLDQLSIEQIISNFLLNHNPRLHRNEVTSKHTLNRMQELVINIVSSESRYNHIALMLLPVSMKLIKVSLNNVNLMWGNKGIHTVHQIFDRILGCAVDLQSLIILRLYEILYVPKELRNNTTRNRFVRKNQKYKYIKELTDLKSYGKAFRVLQQPEVNNSIAREDIPGLISKYFPDGASKVELEEEVDTNSSYYTRFDDVYTNEETKPSKDDDISNKSKEASTTCGVGVGDDYMINAIDIELALKKVNLASATGVDTWTYSFIKSLWFNKRSKVGFGKAIASLMTTLFRGNSTSDIGKIWSLCRTIFIPKEVVEAKVLSYRPIGITSCWYRLVGKVVTKLVKEKVSAKLVKNGQLGIGIPDGCAITAKVLANFLKDKNDNVFFKMDIKNAFNETPHYLIRKGLKEVCPELIPFWEFIYANNPLLINNGEVVGKLTQGTLQGDSLSTIYFNVALNIILEKLKEKEKNIEIICYHDDVFIMGQRNEINKYKDIAWQIFENNGLTINQDKSKLIDVNTNDIILGVPMGSKEYIESVITTMIEDIRNKIKLVNDIKIETKTRLIFIKACINTCPVYLSRILRLDKNTCISIDAIIDAGISSLVKRDISNSVAAKIRGLPQKLGGLGVYRFELFAKSLFEGLRIKCQDYMHEHFQCLTKEAMFTNEEEASGVIGNIDINMWESTPQADRHHCMLRRVFEEVHNKLLMDKSLVAGAALLLSNCYDNSAYHLTHYYGFKFSCDAKFVACLQNRLLVPIDECYDKMDCCCMEKGYKGMNLDNEHRQCLFPFSHMFNCKRNSGYMIAVHDHVGNGLKDFVKSLVKDATVTMEPFKSKREGSEKNTRPDLKIKIGGVTIFVDISIINPMQNYAIRPTLDKVIGRFSKFGKEAKNLESVSDFLADLKETESNCTKVLYYNRKVEEAKSKKHKDNLDLNENCLFYAFIIDMSGRIGDQGKAFINKIKALSTSSDNSKYKEQFLRRRISYLCLNRGAIARENALLSLIPLNEAEEY